MSDFKVCNYCKVSLPIDKFVTKKVNTKKGEKIRILNICKDCNNYKSKLFYHFKKKANKNKNTNTTFLYRFLSKDNVVLYVGKTDNLYRRIHDHINYRGGLPKECYNKISKIQILQFNSKTLRDINEIYYINIFKPPFNKEYNYDEDRIYIKGLGYEEWHDLDIDLLSKTKSYSFKIINMPYENKDLCDNILNGSYDNYYIGKATIFIRKRNEKFFIYAEYFNKHEHKRKQIKIFESKNENTAKYELLKIKEKKKSNGHYIIDFTKKEILSSEDLPKKISNTNLLESLN